MGDVNSIYLIVDIAAGAVLALVLVGVARTRTPEEARSIYAVGLVVAALIYVSFAAAGDASNRWLVIECIGLLVYGVAAWIGIRRWPWVLALGWAAHVAWDVLLHLNGPGAVYTPHWYPWACGSFDLIVAGALLAPERRNLLH